ncbi:MAG: fructose-6-phosphate aldolase [Candidatus Paracaedibacteraceae bacterium]|nr:fructose-6-phosphate aldolase [Candidatus Paracaedibacteraceae bacterium]
MEFFLDTADVNEVKELIDTGFVDGITTNPTLIARSGRQWKDVVKEMCAIVEGPVSVEVASLDYETMIQEARRLADINEKIAIKVPLTPAGLRVCKELSTDDIMVNVTLCFTPVQALLAAKAGATFVSPFVGRMDDIGHDGMDLIKDIRVIYENYAGLGANILAASIRHPLHVLQAAKAGADVATIPPSVLRQLYKHPLTDRGIDAFVKDWESTGQKI